MSDGYTFYFTEDGEPDHRESQFDKEFDFQLGKLYEKIMQDARAGARAIVQDTNKKLDDFRDKYRCGQFPPKFKSYAHQMWMGTYQEWTKLIEDFHGIKNVSGCRTDYGVHWMFQITLTNYFFQREVLYDLAFVVDRLKPIQADTNVDKLGKISSPGVLFQLEIFW